jgi:hypothetical protein
MNQTTERIMPIRCQRGYYVRRRGGGLVRLPARWPLAGLLQDRQLDSVFTLQALTWRREQFMRWLWLNGAGIALATAYYGQGVSGLERLTLFTLALVALWIFDWRS